MKDLNKNLTKKEAVTLHRVMWKIMAEITLTKMWDNVYDIKKKTLERMIKEGYISEFDNTDVLNAQAKITNMCFCCQYAIQTANKVGEWSRESCSYCPIVWQEGRWCACPQNEYNQYIKALKNRQFGLASALAVVISELPERRSR